MRSATVLDSKVLDKLEMEAGPSVRLKAIDEFLATLPHRLDDACDAGRVGDSQSLGQVLQSIRDAAGYVGAIELRELAGRIEKLCRYGARELLMPMLVQLQAVMNRAEEGIKRERKAMLHSRKVTIH
jgi:HPt (histidine-containing phosphotransfer) domain-containing protein